ncbi:hypothetical protein M9Y10_005915 [Tritrichomonas musculus]|uniref:Uncharacterized protein n=1 Tax=Tritrichomonas musculus TaxID=1915356 RepID=A0ABR2JFM5_9EUKA
MENLQNIGQSYLFYSFLKRLKECILEVQAYYPELIALSSDILNTKVKEIMFQLETLQEEPENIDRNSISQIYFSFHKELKNSQYIRHLTLCFQDFSQSHNYPINQVEHIQIPIKLKEQVQEYLKKCEKNEINEKQLFSIYNSNDNIYQKNNHKINFIDDITRIFATNDVHSIPINFKSSLEQMQKMINVKTIIQKLLQMKPFFKKIDINVEDNQIPNEYSDSELDSDSSESGSGSESYLDPEIDLKIGEISSDADKSSLNENDSSVDNDQIIRLKYELDSTKNNLKSALSENVCLKSKIEKLLSEKENINDQLHEIEDLRKEQIKAVEENALLKKENEKLKDLKDETSSSMASLLIVPSTDLNDILDHSNKEEIIFNNFDIKENNKVCNSKDEGKVIKNEKEVGQKGEEKTKVTLA